MLPIVEYFAHLHAVVRFLYSFGVTEREPLRHTCDVWVLLVPSISASYQCGGPALPRTIKTSPEELDQKILTGYREIMPPQSSVPPTRVIRIPISMWKYDRLIIVLFFLPQNGRNHNDVLVLGSPSSQGPSHLPAGSPVGPLSRMSFGTIIAR